MDQATASPQTSAGFGAVINAQDVQQQQLMVSQLNEFTFQMELRRRLQACFCSLAQQIPLHNIGCVQVWRAAGQQQPGVDPLLMQLYADPELVILGDSCFTSFRISSCQSLQWGKEGMPGRVLKSGCVQVVQNLRIIPDVLHPRCRLTDAVTDYIGEAVYVPVFCTSRPHLGPVAVLEAVLSAHATDAMLVANFISIAGTALSAMQLSLSNPLPQPVRRSKLEGRKPRPIHPASSGDLQQCCPTFQPAAAASPAAVQQHGTVVAAAACPAIVQGSYSAATAAVNQQQECSCCASPASPDVSDACDGGPTGNASSCSAASTEMAVGSIGAAVTESSLGAAAVSAADNVLDSTLSSRLRAAASMPPPQPYSISSKQRRRYCCCDEGDAVVPEAFGHFERPRKLQRTLSRCRTKSVPVGLDQILDAAVAATAVDATGIGSC